MFAGFKTFTYAAGLILAVLTIPQVQELIATYPTASAVINGIVIAALRAITATSIFNTK